MANGDLNKNKKMGSIWELALQFFGAKNAW